MPGGFGTLDEFFEALTLIQTNKIAKRPVVLVGKKYWSGLITWIEESMLGEENNISAQDLSLFKLVDTADEAVAYIEEFFSSNLLSPNF
jgi:predicted Rossmann-fold nucleotide-binding protein